MQRNVCDVMQAIYAVNDYLDQGGAALYVIFLMAVLLWALIIERTIYIAFFFRAAQEKMLRVWRVHHTHADATKIRQALKSTFRQNLYKGFDTIRVLITIAPLLGLYGTVYGMIEIFDVIAQAGTGDARAMANGISMATLSTMSGMAVAISGLFFHHQIQAAANRKIIQFNEILKTHEKNNS